VSSGPSYSSPTIDVLLGLKNPLPTISNPRAKYRSDGTAIAKCPSIITTAPMTAVSRNPRNLSAIHPPRRGVRYSSIVYVPYIESASAFLKPSEFTRYRTSSAWLP
jgi:hypothetical protein